MKYHFLLVLTVFFWSGNFIFARFISSDIEPMELSFYRWFFVLLLLFPYILINYSRIFKFIRRDSLLLILLGALGIAGYNTFLYYGLQTTTAINALLINSSTPIIIVILSAIILKIVITKVQVFGILLSSFGVIYLILKGNIESFLSLQFESGDLWVLLAGLDWALYSILLKFKPKDINAFDFLSITTVVGVLILYIVFIAQGYSLEFSFISNDEVLYSLIYMVVFPSILSFYFWNISTLELGANKAGQYTHLMPVFGSILAFFILDESLEFYHLVGIIFIGIGIYLSVFYSKKANR